ncbi:MAG: FG-GAP-like repeat, partial [Bacteroidota bacterium]
MKRSLITVTLLLCFLYESIGQTCFAPAVNIPLGTNLSARSITCTDFNKDGKPDLATANYYGTSILIGKGDGTFRVTTSATGTTGGPLA